MGPSATKNVPEHARSFSTPHEPNLLYPLLLPNALASTFCPAPTMRPIVRTPPQISGGNPGPDDCSGTYDFHFSHAYLAGAGVLAGDRIHSQFWSRDPAASFSVGLTDAIVFDVVP